jgi:riboflavin biosynthesis pyrimidine reductase
VKPEELHPWPTGQWVRALMIVTVDGRTTGGDGVSGSISGPPDRALFAAQRRGADVVLVGAGTVRLEQYRPARVPTAVVSGRLDLDPGAALFTGSAPVHIVTTEDADPDRMLALASVAEVIVAGETSVDPTWALSELRARGYRRVLCEGGPRLLGTLAAADLVDDYCVTLSPMLVGGHAPGLLPGAPSVDQRLALEAIAEADDLLFVRYRRVR